MSYLAINEIKAAAADLDEAVLMDQSNFHAWMSRALAYERLDDRVIVTTAPAAVADFVEEGPKLVDSDAFLAAAERVDLGERTRGFAYVDIDGLVPLIESVAGPSAVPDEARDVLESLDSFILEGSGDGPTTELDGFVRVTR